MATESHKFTILIVEDEAGPRDALKMILRPFFNLLTADNAHTAMRLLRDERIDLVTLDLKLPDRQGMDLLQDIKLERGDIEVIIITGYGSLKSAMDGIRYGAAAYLLKPFNVTELIALINQTLAKKLRLDRVRSFLRSLGNRWGTEEEAAAAWKQLDALYSSQAPVTGKPATRTRDYSEIAPLLSDLIEAKSRDLFGHSCRVSCYAALVAEHLNLSAAERKALAIGAFLHDLGKIGIEDRILSGVVRLNESDTEALRRHTDIGARMILPFRLPAEVGQIISYHHERYDGAGYPNGLQGDGIPFLARIVCIAQAFDHLVSDHDVRPPLPIEEACEHVRQQGGTRFDPALADLFARVISECKASIPALVTSSRSAALPES